MKKLGKVLKIYFIAAGVAANVFVVWMAAGWPMFFDRLLVQAQRPYHGDFIVCITGGITCNNLPPEEGWKRIYASVQLYFDGYAKKVIFTGGGAAQITEAEVYAEAAGWLGLPAEAVAMDPVPSGTAEHPANVLKIEGLGVTKESVLNVVTSELHSKRVALCFEKAGFRNFRMVTHYVARQADPAVVRHLRISQFASYKPSGKSYGDVLNRIRWRTAYFFMAVREAGVIVWYKIKGYI